MVSEGQPKLRASASPPWVTAISVMDTGVPGGPLGVSSPPGWSEEIDLVLSSAVLPRSPLPHHSQSGPVQQRKPLLSAPHGLSSLCPSLPAEGNLLSLQQSWSWEPPNPPWLGALVLLRSSPNSPRAKAVMGGEDSCPSKVPIPCPAASPWKGGS